MNEPDDTPATPPPTADEMAERGRRQSTAAAISVIGALLLFAMLGVTPLVGLVVQLVVFGLLFFQHFRGRGWARWILVSLTGVIAAINVWGAIAGPEQARIISIGLAVIFGWNAAVLAVSRHVTSFLTAQRARHA